MFYSLELLAWALDFFEPTLDWPCGFEGFLTADDHNWQVDAIWIRIGDLCVS